MWIINDTCVFLAFSIVDWTSASIWKLFHEQNQVSLTTRSVVMCLVPLDGIGTVTYRMYYSNACTNHRRIAPVHHLLLLFGTLGVGLMSMMRVPERRLLARHLLLLLTSGRIQSGRMQSGRIQSGRIQSVLLMRGARQNSKHLHIQTMCIGLASCSATSSPEKHSSTS